jgi:thioredoxin reductase (NADPH)
MSRYLVDRIEAAPNIEVVTGVSLTEVCGAGHLEGVMVKSDEGAPRRVDAAALFVFIGVSPRTEQFADFVALDPKGFVLTGDEVPRKTWNLDRDPLMFETSVPGVFAAGDVRSGANRRIAAAVGEGSATIYSVHQYLRSV